jgi:hypothetical protein
MVALSINDGLQPPLQELHGDHQELHRVIFKLRCSPLKAKAKVFNLDL